jgi:Niemann-Pick C1 protein
MICRERHSEEYCAMYDICGAREDGKVLNCPYGSPSVKVSGFSLFLFFN